MEVLVKERYLLFVAVILIVWSSGFSQAFDRSLSIKGGFNLANVIGKNTENFEYNKGIMLGFSKNVWPSDSRLNSQMELFFTMKGASVTYKNEFDENVEVFYELYYIEFPFMLKFNMRNGKQNSSSSNIFLNAGCAFGFNISAESIEDNDITRNISSQINNQEFGFVGGVSYESRFKNENKFSLEFRYNRSLSNILETDDFDNYNEVFSIILGFSILDF
jgi:hypothetical protein